MVNPDLLYKKPEALEKPRPLGRGFKVKLPSSRVISFLAIGVGLLILLFSTQPARNTVGKVLEEVGIKSGNGFSVSGGSTSDGASEGQPTQPAGPAAWLTSDSTDQILQLVNDYRKSQGLPEIVKNDRFCEWANARAKSVSQNYSQQVYTQEKDYIFRAVCLKCKKMGELLSRGAGDVQDVVNRWLADAETKTTMSYAGYNIGCVGGYTPDQLRTYLVMVMGEKVESTP